MAYYRSEKFRIPVPQEGTYFDETEEVKLADVVDKLFYRVIQIVTPFGEGTGIVEEGVFSASYSDNNSFVYLSSDEENPSIYAFVDFKPIYTSQQIVWGPLENDKTYYLYIKTVEAEEESTIWFGDFETVASETLIASTQYLLVATATIVNGEVTIETNPEGKRKIHYSTDYDIDMDGTVDDSERLSGKTLEYILDRAHHIGKIDWLDISTEEHKVQTDALSENERASLRFGEIFGSYWVSGELPQTSEDLTHIIPSQVVVINGKRVVTEETEKTYIPNRDIYVDVDNTGTLVFKSVDIGAEKPALTSNEYRLFRVRTKYEEKAQGKIWIQFKPTAGDTVVIHDKTFTATDNLSEVQPGNYKFYTGVADNHQGWAQCAISLINAINSSSVEAQAIIGSATNEIVVISTKTGTQGNEPIMVSTARRGDIIAEGLSNGHGDCITEIEDYRKKLLPYWKEPVLQVADLPSSGIDGETRLILSTNSIYRYDASPDQGQGYLGLSSTPTLGDRIKIGKIVLAAGDTTITENRQFKIYTESTENENIFNTLGEIKKVIENSLYPPSNLLANFVSPNLLEIKTAGVNREENRSIELLIGDSAKYYFSGISGASDPVGWVLIGQSGLESNVEIIRDTKEIVSGSDLIEVGEFEDNALFVYRNGLLQTKDKDYEVVGSSGIRFLDALESGESIHWVIVKEIDELQTKPLREYTFVTKERHPELLKSIDLDSHHILHDEISHDTVPISDPSNKYPHRGTYKILADHIFDDFAHGLPDAVTFRWKILRGTSAEKFAMQFTTLYDFSEILASYDSSTITDDKGIFEYYAGEFPWVQKYSSNYFWLAANGISGLNADDGVYYTTSGTKILKGDETGSAWLEINVGNNGFNDIEVFQNKIYLGGTDGKLYYKTNETWDSIQTESVSIYALGIWKEGSKLLVAGDGEVYEYDEENGLTSLVDIPVTEITDVIEYGGILFLGTYGPSKIYKFDGSSVFEDHSFSSGNRIKFCIFEGKLYAISGNEIYYKQGLLSPWVFEYRFASTAYTAVVHKGILYVGTSREVYYKSNTGWVKDYDFGSSSRVILTSYGENLFAGCGGKIYLRHGNLGWVKVPPSGVDSTVFAGREVRFILKDAETISAIKKTGFVFLRYKQYPTDNSWRYYPIQSGDTKDELVRVTGDDSTAGFLYDKFLAGQNILFETITSTSGSKKLKINATDEKVKSSFSDTTPGFLNEKVQDSITVDTSTNKIKLINDVTNPGVRRVYATGINGVKGWYYIKNILDGVDGIDEKVKADQYDLTAGYLSEKVSKSIRVNEETHTLELVGDRTNLSPSMYYGTPINGTTRGFYPMPYTYNQLPTCISFSRTTSSTSGLLGIAILPNKFKALKLRVLARDGNVDCIIEYSTFASFPSLTRVVFKSNVNTKYETSSLSDWSRTNFDMYDILVIRYQNSTASQISVSIFGVYEIPNYYVTGYYENFSGLVSGLELEERSGIDVFVMSVPVQAYIEEVDIYASGISGLNLESHYSLWKSNYNTYPEWVLICSGISTEWKWKDYLSEVENKILERGDILRFTLDYVSGIDWISPNVIIKL